MDASILKLCRVGHVSGHTCCVYFLEFVP